MSIFRPPILRSASTLLDRSLFSKTFPIAAARIFNNTTISKFRTSLTQSQEILVLERFANVRSDPDISLASKGGKCILLDPKVKSEGKLPAFGIRLAILTS